MKNYYYAHEHVTIDLAGLKNDQDARLDNFDQAVEEFGTLYDKGVSTIVDQTTRGMGRNPLYSEAVAQKTKLKVLHSTGYYKAPFLPEEAYLLTEKEMADLMIRELTVGIEDTDIRANHIGEIGTGLEQIKEEELKIFNAACFAHHETGAAICTHCTLGNLGLEQLEVFKKQAVPLDRVVLSHIDLSGNYEYMLSLVDQGVNIAFDTIGKENYLPDSDRVELLTRLLQSGYSDQIVLSVDITRKSHLSKNGGLGYAYLIDVFLPKLTEAGCRQEWLNKIMSENPERIYGK